LLDFFKHHVQRQGQPVEKILDCGHPAKNWINFGQTLYAACDQFILRAKKHAFKWPAWMKLDMVSSLAPLTKEENSDLMPEQRQRLISRRTTIKHLFLPLFLTVIFSTVASAENVFTYTPIKHASFVLQSGPATINVDPGSMNQRY
jgi:hypothetical protein